ncbi:MAG: hypothetical protein ACN6O1_11050 [Comamonas sp.]|uniref:hypothetical protein n=1 Tax=Comamonas sp. TaxID=34028 RepID=UPI003D0E4523
MKPIEWLIGAVFTAAVFGFVYFISQAHVDPDVGFPGASEVSWGFNGVTETRCISGLKFVVGEGGQARQVIGANGLGVPCGGAQ